MEPVPDTPSTTQELDSSVLAEAWQMIESEESEVVVVEPTNNNHAEHARPTTNMLLDRENRAVAEMLTCFKKLVELAAMPEGQQTKEVAAANALEMEVLSNALVNAAQDLLKLTREMKELWLGGPLREIGEGDGDGEMDDNAVKVGEMVEDLLKKASELKLKDATS